jgi:hypothetical protein
MKHFLFLVLFTPFIAFCQPAKMANNANTYKCMFGLGWSAIDDDGDPKALFNVKDWQYELFPTRLMFDYYFYKGWSGEASVGFTRYKSDRLVNGQLGMKGFFLSTDVNLKYSFYRMLNEGVIDPYVIMGAGVSMRNCDDTLVGKVTPTINVGAGVNFWINNAIGIQVQSCGKIGLTSDLFGNADYFQHSIGLVVRLESMGGDSEGTFQKKNLHLDMKKKKIKTPKNKHPKGKGDA